MAIRPAASTTATPAPYLQALLQCLERVDPQRTTNANFQKQLEQAIATSRDEPLPLPSPSLAFPEADQLFLSNQTMTELIRELRTAEQNPLLEIVTFLQAVVDKREARNDLWPEGRLQLGIAYAALADYANARRVLEEVINICASGGRFSQELAQAA